MSERISAKWWVPSIGERYGSLVVESLSHTTQLGRFWMMRCDCGGASLRSSAILNQKLRYGQAIACIRCLTARRRDRRNRAAYVNGKRWAAHFRKYGNAWPWEAEQMLAKMIAEGLSDHGHQGPDDRLGERAFERMPSSAPTNDSERFYAMTLDEIGRELGVSRERVRQIQENALRKLAKVAAKEGLDL